MKLKKSFQLALNILLHSKLRSWLTIIGIVIGIGSVVSIVSISSSAQQQLEENLEGLGANVITITKGFSQAFESGGDFRGFFSGGIATDEPEDLTQKDINVIESIQNVEYVMGVISEKGDLTYSSKTASLNIQGVDEAIWKEVTTEEILEGRVLTSGDINVVVLGGNIVDSTFSGDIKLNSQVTIEGKSFKVVGITESGSTVYMPIKSARDIFNSLEDDEFTLIQVKIKNIEIADETVDEITTKLMYSRGILREDDRDFTVINPSSFQETITSTLNVISLFLGAIAGISLLVGGVGIANTMFTSVLEKTKDIGIMKAIGAKNIDIMLIFLINSGLIGLVGGLGGVILGSLASIAIGSLTGGGGPGPMSAASSSIVIAPELIIGALLFSILIGMIAGAIPAYRASKLKPVDALRYE